MNTWEMFVITNNERNYIVYCHVFPTGETLKECKKYFGITGRDYNERWGNNGIGYYGQHVFSAILYYGWSNITHYIMYRNLTKEEAEQKEKELIARYKTTDPRYGYNIAEGGIDTAKYHKKVICINTGEVFLTAKEAGIKYNARVDHACRGVTKTAGIHPETKEKLIWQFYDEWLINPKPYTKMKRKKDMKKEKKRYICIETHKVYDKLKLASEQIGVDASSISSTCMGKQKTAGGYHWAYYDEYIKDPDKYDKSINSRDNNYLKKIVCINTEEVFNSITDASNKYNVSGGSISMCCKGTRNIAGINLETGEGLEWQFYDEWLLNPKQCNNIKHDKHGKRKVLCIETNKIYNSCSEASNSINISCSGITKACKGKQKTAGGLHWKYVDD